jgi:hypothetical protein
MKTFLIEVVQLELRISPRIFEKIRNGLNGIIRGLGATDPCKNPCRKSRVTVSLNTSWTSALDRPSIIATETPTSGPDPPNSAEDTFSVL